MKEKFVMTSFFAGNLTETAVTALGLGIGHPENGPLMRQLVESGNVSEALILKVGVAATLIGLYALSKEKGFKRSSFVMDRTVRALNLIFWGAAALNTARIAGLI